MLSGIDLLKRSDPVTLPAAELNRVQEALRRKDLLDVVQPFQEDVTVYPLRNSHQLLQFADHAGSCIKRKLSYSVDGFSQKIFADGAGVYFGIDGLESKGYMRFISAQKVWNQEELVLADVLRDAPSRLRNLRPGFQEKSQAIPIVALAYTIGAANTYFRLPYICPGKRETEIRKLGWHADPKEDIGILCYCKDTYFVQMRPVSSMGFQV